MKRARQDVAEELDDYARQLYEFIDRKGLGAKYFPALLGLTYQAFWYKLRGERDFTPPERFMIDAEMERIEDGGQPYKIED